MTQALYSAKTGLSAGQTQVDVIANNVANINTTAYKSANITFQTLFSDTLSSGSASGKNNGGTNPEQIGMGTQVGSITRNFKTGSVQTTGDSHDFMISGNGYFVVQDANGSQYLTRDGGFTLDSAGNLTKNGYEVVGTTDSFSTKTGTSTVSVPTLLNATVSGTDSAQLGSKTVSDLNDVSLSKGSFTINVGSNTSTAQSTKFSTADGGATYTYNNGVSTITYNKLSNPSTAEQDNIKQIYGSYDSTATYYKGADSTYIKGEPTSGTITIKTFQKTASYTISDADLAGTVGDLVNSINAQFKSEGYPGLQFHVEDGKLNLTNSTGQALSANSTQGSNFLTQLGFTTAFESGTTTTPEAADASKFTNPATDTYKYNNGVSTITYNKVATPDAAKQADIEEVTGASYDPAKDYYQGTDGSYIIGTPSIVSGDTNTIYPVPQPIESSTINESVNIKNVVSPSTAATLKDWSIGEDGIMTATYSDGSSLTVTMDANDKTSWKYTTADKVTITGSGSAGSDVDTSNSTLNPGSMILQLATVVNEGGLVSTTDNLWTAGPNTGTTYYGVAGDHAFGSIESGVLEGSNVDMTTELSNMITAQRAIQMNSRVFSTASSILQTITMMGQ